MGTEFSIITVNLDNVAGLRKTIKSVLSQTWKGFEWIIIDGGSKDGSKKLIEENEAHVSYWCSEQDKGIYNAMNKGAAKATGEYLLYLNSGDVLYDNTVLERVHAIGLHSDIVSGQMIRMDNGELLRKYDSDILMQLFNRTINHQATFIRRTLFNEIGYDERFKIVSDWKFWLESIVLHHCSFEILDLCIAKQDMTGISFSEKYREQHLAERKQVLDELFPPRVIDTLEDYQSLRSQSAVRNLQYLEEKHPRIFVLIKKSISFVTLVCQRIKHTS